MNTLFPFFQTPPPPNLSLQNQPSKTDPYSLKEDPIQIVPYKKYKNENTWSKNSLFFFFFSLTKIYLKVPNNKLLNFTLFYLNIIFILFSLIFYSQKHHTKLQTCKSTRKNIKNGVERILLFKRGGKFDKP
jgi:hypothetical protein